MLTGIFGISVPRRVCMVCGAHKLQTGLLGLNNTSALSETQDPSFLRGPPAPLCGFRMLATWPK